MFRLAHSRQTIYLSASWAERNRPLNLSIAALLAEQGLIVIGEHPTRPSEQGGMDYAERVDEYFQNCAGIVLVFPFRAGRKQTTSSAMFIELLVAAKYGLPILIVLEYGVILNPSIVIAETTLAFGGEPGLGSITRFDDLQGQLSDGNISRFNPTPVIHNTSTVVIPTPHFIDVVSLSPYALSGNLTTESGLMAAVEGFVHDLVTPQNPQYVFQISPYTEQRDRAAMADIVFRVSGLKCVNGSDSWAGAPFPSEREIASQIANSLFVLADLTGNRGACLFEVGCAIGAGRPISVVRAKTADRLPFGLRTLKVYEYESEEEFSNAVTQCCWPFRRRVFNVELEAGTRANDRSSNSALSAQLQLMTDTVFPRLLEATRMKHVTFHGPVGAYVDGGEHHQLTTNQTVNDLPQIRALVEELSRRQHELQFPPRDAETVGATLNSLKAALSEERPQSSLLREGLTSLRHIFEHAAGAMFAHEAPTWLPAVTHQIEAFLQSLR